MRRRLLHPFSALTAWQGLIERARLASGERVLIHGAAGGVGPFAVQLGRWRGAKVIGTVRIVRYRDRHGTLTGRRDGLPPHTLAAWANVRANPPPLRYPIRSDFRLLLARERSGKAVQYADEPR